MADTPKQFHVLRIVVRRFRDVARSYLNESKQFTSFIALPNRKLQQQKTEQSCKW